MILCIKRFCGSGAFAFDETDQNQQYNRADKGADDRAKQIGRRDAQQPENKSAEQRADDADNEIA